MRRAALCVLAALAAAVPAAGQPKPRPKTVREELDAQTKRSWDTAVELYGVRDFEGARAEFARIYETTKNPRVLYNVAICEKDLSRYRAAAQTLRGALERRADLPKDDAAAMEAALHAIEPFITKVEVVANEPGATLYVDDVPIGTTPLTEPPAVDAGSHTVRLSKPGFADDVRKVTFTTAGANKLVFELAPLVERTHVTVAVAGAAAATVFLDGKDVGLAPFAGDVEAGRHVIEARAEDYVTTKQTVTLAYKQPAAFVLALAPQRHEGTLRVDAKPADASIEIDGKAVGHGAWEGPLASRVGHQLVVRRDGYFSQATEIVLADEQARSVPVTLNPEKTWVFWVIGAAAVVAGGTAAAYFALRAPDRQPIPGTLQAGSAGFGTAHFH